jgi:hypothetical protein
VPRIDRIACLVLLVGALGGCSADLYFDRRDTIAFHAGDAVAANMAMQTIDPWPKAAANRNIAYNGERMAGAAERYRTNRVTPPQGTSTSSVKYQPVVMAPPADSK